jgi:hypothetical protein
MLHFFRHIRQTLFLQGKATRYLGYALGEIALIVIGILIAVQIGKWNQARADANLIKTYIERLIVNIERDGRGLRVNIGGSEIRLRFIDLLLDAANDPEIVRERSGEFLLAVENAPRVRRTPLFSDIYDELVSTGYLRLLDDQLKLRLYNYYHADQRIRLDQPNYDAAVQRYFELSAGVLNQDQAVWVLTQFPSNIYGRDLDTVKTLVYDEASVVEAAKRLQRNEDLVHWLPRLKKNSTQNHEGLLNTTEDGEKLLEILKTKLEESR